MPKRKIIVHIATSADGYIARNENNICFTNNDLGLRMRVTALWFSLFLGRSRFPAIQQILERLK